MKQMKKWVSVLLALLLLGSLTAPVALAADPVILEYREATENISIRSGAGESFSVVQHGYVPKGDVVGVLNKWYVSWWKVTYTSAGGTTAVGYVRSSCLKETTRRKNEKKSTAALGCYRAVLELNFRSGPGTNYEAITAVPQGNVVDVTDTSNEGWYRCTFINKRGTKYTGYLSAKYLKKAAEPFIVQSATQLRKSASSSAKNLQTLPKGSYLFVTAVYSSKWYKVEYTGVNGKKRTGYVLRSKVKRGAVTNKPYKQVDPEAGARWAEEQWRTQSRWQLTEKTKLLSTASAKGKKVATLAKGTVVAVANSSGKYYKVIWNNSECQKKVGYLPKSKLKKFEDRNGGDYVTQVKTSLRESDSETGKVMVKLPAHTLLTVADTSEEDWCWATYTDGNGKKYVGFVQKDHVEKYVEKNAGEYCTTVKTELRETASDTGTVLKKLPKGVLVQVERTSNPDWYYVSYTFGEDGKKLQGYADSALLRRFQSRKQSYVAVCSTKMRIQPDDCAKVSARIPEGEHLLVNDTPVEDWYWASFSGDDGKEHIGYVYAPHLKEYEEKQEEPAQEDAKQEQKETVQEGQQSPEKEEDQSLNAQDTDEPVVEDQVAEPQDIAGETTIASNDSAEADGDALSESGETSVAPLEEAA